MIRIILIALIAVLALLLVLCLLIPDARRHYWHYLMKDMMKELWDIVVDYLPERGLSTSKTISSFTSFFLAVILCLLASILFVVLILVCGPTMAIIRAIKKTEAVNAAAGDQDVPVNPAPKRTPEQIRAENLAWVAKRDATRFYVPRRDLCFEPDEDEVIFYSPFPVPHLEEEIQNNLRYIKKRFQARGYRFVFLPDFNAGFDVKKESQVLDYYNPSRPIVEQPDALLTYDEIKIALSIPDKVDAPCLIRCKRAEMDPVIFSFFKIQGWEDGVCNNEQPEIRPVIEEYLANVGDGRMYSLESDDTIRKRIEGLPADQRYDKDVYLIGNEIRERLEKLRAKGLSEYAIRKLIGDDSDKPGKLLIDKHNKVILTDYNNKEIKLSPIHKAVFFLFLRHPEGIYFKDLPDYREELGRIYKEITGRDDLAAVEDSIEKLTNPMDNSINEKCARIKNAFVSEFREEVAQWYFIDGRRGEKKTIKLPRELVTWEIKD